MKKIILVLGTPLSGKKTQSKLLAESLNYKYVLMDDVIKSEIENKTKIGLIAEKYINTNTPIPDEYYIMLIKDLVINLKQEGVVFCGFPKTIAQAKALDLFLFSRKNEKAICVFLKLDPIVTLSRFGSADEYRVKQNEFNLNSQPVVDYYSNNKIEIEASNKSNVELNNEILKCISI